MTKLKWDQTGERKYETGVNQCALYVYNTNSYDPGVAWNGITSISESPDGAEANDLWADNQKYATLRSAENFGGTIEAYSHPSAFYPCDGVIKFAGMIFGQQTRKKFGLVYTTRVGSDNTTTDDGEILHLVYGATASPSERSYETINDSPDAITFSWEFETTPEVVSDKYSAVTKATSILRIDTTRLNSTQLTRYETLKNWVYGSDKHEPTLLLPDQVFALMQDGSEPANG